MSIRDAIPFRQTTQRTRGDGLPIHREPAPEPPSVPEKAPAPVAEAPPEPEATPEPEERWGRRSNALSPYKPEASQAKSPDRPIVGSPSTGFRFLPAGQDVAEAVAQCQQFAAPPEKDEADEPENAKGLIPQKHGGALVRGGIRKSPERLKARETQELYLAALRRAVDPNVLECVLGRIVKDALGGKVSAQRIIASVCLPATVLADVLLQQDGADEPLRVAGMSRGELDQTVAIHLMALVEKYQTKKEKP